MLGDLNGLVKDRLKASITGGFEVAKENDDGRRVTDFCAERRLCVGNICFEHKSSHKYIRMARG